MPWTKKNNSQWNYASGVLEGYIVLVKFKNGTQEYQGMVWNTKTRKTAPAVRASTLTACKNTVMRKAKALKK